MKNTPQNPPKAHKRKRGAEVPEAVEVGSEQIPTTAEAEQIATTAEGVDAVAQAILTTAETADATVEQIAATPETADAPPPAVTLASSCTVKDAAALKTSLCALLDHGARVVIDGAGVERIDTASMQLLCAFVRDRLAADREVVWSNASAVVADAARLLGVRDLLCLPAAKATEVAA